MINFSEFNFKTLKTAQKLIKSPCSDAARRNNADQHGHYILTLSRKQEILHERYKTSKLLVFTYTTLQVVHKAPLTISFGNMEKESLFIHQGASFEH